MVEASPPRVVFEILRRLVDGLGEGPFVEDIDNFLNNLVILYNMCNYPPKQV
jgi:hypothetical protein